MTVRVFNLNCRINILFIARGLGKSATDVEFLYPLPTPIRVDFVINSLLTTVLSLVLEN